MRLPLNQERLEHLLLLIEEALESLRRFQGFPYETFAVHRDNFRIAYFDLHRALEAIMDIGNHILSRIPGVRPTRYKDIALLLGEHGIVPREFAQGSLVNMAGYRNRMVHFYAEITPQELHTLIQHHLEEIEAFTRYIKSLLKDPGRFGFRV